MTAVVQPGEIALWGKVTAYEPATDNFLLQTRGFEVPGGRRAVFANARDRTVRLDADAVLLTPADDPAVRDELQNGDWVFIIGRDLGSTVRFAARFLRHYGPVEPVLPASAPPENSSEPNVSPAPISPQAPPAIPFLPSPPKTAFMALSEVSPWLRQAAAAFPDDVRIVPIAVTAGARPILAVVIAPPGVPLWQLRRVAVICRLHGDEPETTAAALELIRQHLLSRTPRAARLRRSVALLIVPVANPDGAPGKRRRNAVAQDLNRDWGRSHSREVTALTAVLAAWKPHLIIDVHQWVPGDREQTPMAEASGGALARRAASAMSRAAKMRGLRLAYHSCGIGGVLCHRYWAGRGIPSVLLETIHRPRSTRHRQISIATSVIALQRALDVVTGP